MKTENIVNRARRAVAEGLAAERAYCVALTKSKHNATPETRELLNNADQTFKAARRAVAAAYKKLGCDVPKMPTIFIAENCLTNLIKRI